MAVTWLNQYGDGTLTFRYNNVIPAGDGNVFGMIRTFITNPAYMITQIMSKDNIEFIISVTGALAFVPFAVKSGRHSYCLDHLYCLIFCLIMPMHII